MTRPLRVLVFGECMLELRGTAFGTLQQGCGGDTYNTAVYLARCGGVDLAVAYATAVGDDALSEGLLQRWAAEGLQLDAVRRLPGRLPGLYQIEVDAAGERRFSYWREHSAARAYFDTPRADTVLETVLKTVPEPPLDAQAGARALYFSGISLAILPPAGRQRLLALARRLRAAGGWVVFDNNYRPRLWPDADTARAAYRQALACTDIALLTLDDEQALWGAGSEALQLQQSLAAPCPEVVVKRGARATLLRCAGQPLVEVATEPVPQVVDSTAAGDAFAGAYLARRLAGAAPEAAARAGNRLAARVVQHPGAVIPRSAMIDLMPATGDPP